MADQVKLLGAWFSPFSRRVEMALKLKGVEYEYIEQDLSTKSDLLVKCNPIHQKVPVLLHDGNSISESLVLLEYVDEAFEGPCILPEGPYERAMARFWAKFINEDCSSAMWKVCTSTGEETEKLKEEAIAQLKIVDNELKGKKFFGGDTIGYVDLAANGVGYWFKIMEEVTGLEIITTENLPNLYRWVNDYVNDDFVKGNLPDKERLTVFFKALAQPRVGNEYRPPYLAGRMLSQGGAS